MKRHNTTSCANSCTACILTHTQVNIALWFRLCNSHLLSKDTSPLDAVITSTTACSTCCDSLLALCPSLVLTRQRPCMLICRVWATARSFSVKLRRLSPPTLYVCADTRKNVLGARDVFFKSWSTFNFTRQSKNVAKNLSATVKHPSSIYIEKQ